MIRLSFDNSDQRVMLALRARGPKILAAEKRTIEELMLELQARIQRKLSGEVLQSHAGGGGLLGTVRKQPTTLSGAMLHGGVQAGGGLFWWAAVHERGGEKEYEILPGALTGKSDKQALAFFPAGSAGASFGRTATTKLRFRLGKRAGSLRPGQVKAFGAAGGIVVRKVIHPPLKRRSFMESSLEELRGRIIARVFETAAQVMR